MATTMTSLVDTTSVVLPEWADRIRQLFLAGEASVFIVHGNVQDYVLYDKQFMPIRHFMSAWMNKVNKTMLELSVRRGLLTQRYDDAKCELSETSMSETSSLSSQLAVIDAKLKGDGHTVCIPYAQAFVPSGEPQYRSSDERMMLASIQDWSLDPKVSRSDSILILMTDSLSQVPSELISNPRIACVEIALPTEALRLATIAHVTKRSDSGLSRLALQTAGLKAIQIANIFGHGKGMTLAQRQKFITDMLTVDGVANLERVDKMAAITGGMTPDEIRTLVGGNSTYTSSDEEVLSVLAVRKRAIIEKECAGLIEFMDSKHGLDSVGGNAKIKTELLRIAQIMKKGDTKLAPMGLLAVGAMGAGKTFVIKAFLKEAGLTGVTLKNFRSKWVGSTESNLEKVLATVKAMGPVAVVIDESDRSFGNGGDGDGDGGTSSRVIARLKEFMSDTENRGKVLFIMMTNRPDKLDTDIKRPGRLDRKIPFFYADDPTEIADIVGALCKRYNMPLLEALAKKKTKKGVTPYSIFEKLRGYSNADLEALVGMFANLFAESPEGDCVDLFEQAIVDFIPPREEAMVHFMNLQAIREASRRSLVPERFHHYYDGDALDVALQQARARIGSGR